MSCCTGCYCGNEPLTDSADNCDEPCRGNSAVACGGEGSLSVFMFDVPMTPAPVAVTPAPVDVTLENDEADGTTLIGCFVDDGTYNTRGRRWGS
ncbi:unnamed protein product, partial [Sphacelaria rigidula]